MVGMSDAAIPGWVAGRFSVSFFYMGQGDCCVAKLPNGKVMIIDGGSAFDFDEGTDLTRIHNLLDVYAPNDVINFMVLTHPDRDHYNKMIKIMGDRTVENVFMSCGIVDGVSSCTGGYRVANVSGWLRSTFWGTEVIVDVNVNNDGHSINAWVEDDQFAASIDFSDEDEVDLLPAYLRNQLVDGTGDLLDAFLTVDQGADWWVTIVAGNVGLEQHDRTTAVPEALKNGASLVTRMRINNGVRDTLIVHGDADFDTMYYLEDSNRDNNLGLADTNVVHMPHHGSPTGFYRPYIELLNPEYAVISVALGEYDNRLPWQEVIDDYIAIMTDANTGRGQNLYRHDLVGWVFFPTVNAVWTIIQGWLTAGYYVQFRNSGNNTTRRATQADVTNRYLGRYTIITDDYNTLPNNSYYMALPAHYGALRKREYTNGIQETGLPASRRGPVNFTLTGQ